MVKVENIKVAVRVRPFSDCEKAKECKNIVSMVKRSTILDDPANPTGVPRAFTFDHSYWSHDNFKERPDGYLEPDNRKYIDQRRLFKELGTGIVENAWSGYNCTLFAYGQTGSGKSYTMMGYDPNKGIIPQLCEKLFEDMDRKKQNKVVYQVSFSMLEIYNEKIRDLLNMDEQPKQGLPVRMSRSDGFYVEGLTSYPVAAYRDIEYYMEEGNKNRTLAATKMNETSSRAHTIVKINFAQNYFRDNRTTQSKIYLVDLAGSERAHQTGATGIRFEESKNINRSLMTLGIVIKNLCQIAEGQTSQGPTPHRDSKLTLLLKDAIGGNCKTVMIATISPSDENYVQTLSTLRYADRVKSIRNSVKMNVAATDKLIKDLLAEKEQILETLRNTSSTNLGYSHEEMEKLRSEQQAEIERIRSEMNNAEAAWQRRLQETQEQMEAHLADERRVEEEKAKHPYIWNLNEDPALSGKVYYLIKQGAPVTVGNPRAPVPAVIELHGPSITREHAVLINSKNIIRLKPLQGQVKVNGELLLYERPLKHQDRIYFGTNHFFVLHHPEEVNLPQSSMKTPKITYELAQNEISKYTKVQTDEDQNRTWLKQEVADILTRTQDANAMAVELRKYICFEPVVVASLVLGGASQRARVYVRVKTGNGAEFLWGRNHFLDRYDLMMDVFQKYENCDPKWNPESKTQDPFWEPPETPTLIGVAYLPTECIAHMLDLEYQKIGIYDYDSCLAGYLTVSLVPCDDEGHECGEDRAVEDPIDLVGSDIAFRLKIERATGIPKRFKSSWCQYSFYMEKEKHYTDEVDGVVPKYRYNKLHLIYHVTHEMISYLQDSSLMIEIYGRQAIVSDTDTSNRNRTLLSTCTIGDERRMSGLSNILAAISSIGKRRSSRDDSSTNLSEYSKNTDHIGLENDTENIKRVAGNSFNVPRVVIDEPENAFSQEKQETDVDSDKEVIDGSDKEENDASKEENDEYFDTVSENQLNDSEEEDGENNSAATFRAMRRGIGQIIDHCMKREQS